MKKYNTQKIANKINAKIEAAEKARLDKYQEEVQSSMEEFITTTYEGAELFLAFKTNIASHDVFIDEFDRWEKNKEAYSKTNKFNNQINKVLNED